jgi:hypothetical protein
MPDVAVRPVLRAAVAIAATVAAVVAFALWLLPPAGLPLDDGQRSAAPGLYPAPQPLLEQERARKRQRLDSAGWVDRDAGIAHIPIADAMDLLVTRRHEEAGR